MVVERSDPMQGFGDTPCGCSGTSQRNPTRGVRKTRKEVVNGEAHILVKPVYPRTRTGPVPQICGIAKARPWLTDWSRDVCVEKQTQWRSSINTPTNLRESSNVGRISSLRRKSSEVASGTTQFKRSIWLTSSVCRDAINKTPAG